LVRLTRSTVRGREPWPGKAVVAGPVGWYVKVVDSGCGLVARAPALL
jgi:hypothetical protein